MSDDVDKLTKWLRGKIAGAPMVTRLVLQHAKEGGGSAVDTWKVKGDRSTIAALKFSTEIQERCSSHANAFGKVQLYRVIASTKAGESVGEFPIRIRGTAPETDLADSEAPTGAGMIAQAMRHNEALMRQNSMLLEMALGTMTSANQLVTDENKSLRLESRLHEDRRLKVFETLETLKSAESDRQVTQVTAARDGERKDRAWKTLREMLPNLLGGDSTLKKGVRDFVASLDDSDLAVLRQLPPAKAQKVMALMSSVAEDDEGENPKAAE